MKGRLVFGYRKGGMKRKWVLKLGGFLLKNLLFIVAWFWVFSGFFG